MNKTLLRWQEVFEEVRSVGSIDSQTLFEQAVPCFYKKYDSSAEDDHIPIGASRIGGYPDLPLSLSWPAGRSGNTMIFLAQINFSELEPGFAPYLPRHGWLYFFIDELEEWNDKRHRILFYDGAGDGLIRTGLRTGSASPKRIFRSIRMRFDTGFTLYGTFLDSLIETHPEWHPAGREMQIIFDCFQGERTRLGGHPMSFQPISEQHAYLKLSGYDALFKYGTDLYRLEAFIGRERLEQEDPQLAAYLRTEVARQINEYRRDFATHRERMRSIRPILVLGSEEDMLWGDAGFLQFFLHEDDLAKRNFSRSYCEVIST